MKFFTYRLIDLFVSLNNRPSEARKVLYDPGDAFIGTPSRRNE